MGMRTSEHPSGGERQHLYDIVKSFESAMLVTSTGSGCLRSRPMAIAGCEEDGHVYFFTTIDSPKVEELERQPHVNVSLQGKTRYVSLSGTAHVVRDRALVDRFWSEPMKTWFPNGKEDPALCLLAVDPQEAEFWDNGGSKGVRYLFQAAKAYLTGTTPQIKGDQHAKVPL